MSIWPHIAGICGAWLLAAAPANASRKPHPSVYRMANTAAWVVEGTLRDGGVVEVAREHFAAPGVESAKTAAVPSLPAMPLTSSALVGPATTIHPDTVLLFLEPGPTAGEWQPLWLLEGRARGVLWFVGDEVWGYQQCMNPGPYELTRWQQWSGEWAAAPTPADVRQEIAAGLAARAQWQADLAIGDADQRAVALARWFAPDTSPDGPRWREREWPDLQDAAGALGTHMVAPLARVVATAADEGAVAVAAHALAQLSTAAQAATPAAIARLRDRRGARALDLVQLLQSLQDPRAIAVLRDHLAVAEGREAAATGLALHGCGDAEAGPRIAARVPRSFSGDLAIGDLAAVLDALHDVDAAAAVALVRERFADLEPLRAERNWLGRLAR